MPAKDAVIACNRINPFLAASDPDRWPHRIAGIDKIAALNLRPSAALT